MFFLRRRSALLASLTLSIALFSACHNDQSGTKDDQTEPKLTKEMVVSSWNDVFSGLEGKNVSSGPLSKDGRLYKLFEKYLPAELKNIIEQIPSDLSSLIPTLMESPLGEELFNEENIVRRDRNEVVFRMRAKLCDFFAPQTDAVTSCQKLFALQAFELHLSRGANRKIDIALHTAPTGNPLKLLLSVSLSSKQISGKLSLNPVRDLLAAAKDVLGVELPVDISDLRGQFSWNLTLSGETSTYCAAGSNFCFAINLDDDLDVKLKTRANDISLHWSNNAPQPHFAVSESATEDLHLTWNGAEMDGNFTGIVVHFGGAQVNATLPASAEGAPLEIILKDTRLGPSMTSVNLGSLQLALRVTGQNDEAIDKIRVLLGAEGISLFTSDARVHVLVENHVTEQCVSVEKATWKINMPSGDLAEILIPLGSFLSPEGFLSKADTGAGTGEECDFSLLVLTPVSFLEPRATCDSAMFVVRKGTSEITYDYEVTGKPAESKVTSVAQGQCLG